MQRSRLTKVGLVAGALLLTVIIYRLPKTIPSAEPDSATATTNASAFDISSFVAVAKNRLSQDQLQRLQAVSEDTNSVAYLQSLAMLLDSVAVPGASARCFEQLAEKDPGEANYLNAAYRYFDAYKMAPDSVASSWFAESAIRTYEKVIVFNPDNLNAKTDLGTLYAEATQQPMKGIMLLREVVAADSLHENAQLNLGFLSMKSAQYEKAIERFDKVLNINPSRIDMYVYKGEALVQLGKKKEAIENFKIFRNLTNDQQMIENIDNYIASLENGAPLQ